MRENIRLGWLAAHSCADQIDVVLVACPFSALPRSSVHSSLSFPQMWDSVPAHTPLLIKETIHLSIWLFLIRAACEMLAFFFCYPTLISVKTFCSPQGISSNLYFEMRTRHAVRPRPCLPSAPLQGDQVSLLHLYLPTAPSPPSTPPTESVNTSSHQ